MAQNLSTLKGLAVHMSVGTEINGRIVITFGKDTGLLARAAKPLLISVLKSAGMYLEDLEKWEFKSAGAEIRGMGPLSDASFRRLTGVVQSPVPAIVTASAASPEAAAAPTDPATASQRYFKSVNLVLDNLKTGTYMGETAKWWMQAAGRIDKLPILNVDPALIEWGTMVSMKLKQLGAAGTAGQTQVQARVAASPETYDEESYYDRNNNYHYKKTPSPNNARLKREAALQEKGQLQQQALQVFEEANGARQKVRAEMTAKYNVEF